MVEVNVWLVVVGGGCGGFAKWRSLWSCRGLAASLCSLPVVLRGRGGCCVVFLRPV